MDYQAEQVLILRLVEGVPRYYLTMVASGWRARLNWRQIDWKVKDWYESIERKVTSESVMQDCEFKHAPAGDQVDYYYKPQTSPEPSSTVKSTPARPPASHVSYPFRNGSSNS